MRLAPEAVAAYAEMAADDAALRAHGRRALAGALLALHLPGPVSLGSALHAGATHVPSRIGRLTATSAQPYRLVGALFSGYLLALTAAVLLVVGPSLAVLVQGGC